MKRLTLPLTEYNRDINEAKNDGVKLAVLVLSNALKLPDDGSRFTYLVDELDNQGAKLARLLGFKEERTIDMDEVPF